jgi:thymidylate synthase (FAD)
MIKCLDHGYVELRDHMGNDLSVVQNARQSFNEQWRAGEDTNSDARLINYLWKNKHTTPFESVCFTFEVKAPIFVLRQWHRHRTWSYNELSARYKELPEEYYLPAPNLVGEQSATNKQGRSSDLAETLTRLRHAEIDALKRTIRASFTMYRTLLACGWPRELARIVLPVATYSCMSGTTNLLNLFRFLTLRCDEHAQYEIRMYADAMKELIRPIVPICLKAWETHTHD